MIISFKLLIFFLFSIPITIISGPFIPDLTILLAFIVFIFLLIKNQITLKFSFFVLLSISFFFLVILSFIISLNDETIFGGYLFYIRFPIMSLIIFHVCKKYTESLEILYLIMTFLLAIVSCDAIFQYIFGYNIIGLEDEIQNRISGFFGDEYILGKYLFFMNVIYFYLHFRKPSRFKLVFCCNFLLITIAIILSGERTSLLLYLMFIFLFLFLTNLIKPLFKIFLFILVPLILSFIVLTNQSYLERFYPGFEISSFLLDPSTLVDMSNKYFYTNFLYYIDFVKVSFLIFIENPFFGVGPKMYRVECMNYIDIYKFACSTHPHNTYLQLLSETGIFSALIVLMLWLLIFFILAKELFYKVIYKKKYLSQNLLLLLIAYFAMLFPFFPNNSFFNNNSSILLYFPLGFLLFEIYCKADFNNNTSKFKIIE